MSKSDSTSESLLKFITNITTSCDSVLQLHLFGEYLLTHFSQLPTFNTNLFISLAKKAIEDSVFNINIINDLDKCWELVCEDQFYKSLVKISKINSNRLQQNAKAIVTCAQLASLAMVGDKDKALDSAKELIGLLSKLPRNINVSALNNIDQVEEGDLWVSATANTVSSTSNSERVNIATTAKAQASLRIKGVFKQLSEEGYSTVAAHYWTDYFLQQHSKHEVRYRQAYPLGYKSSGARAEPFLAGFNCYLLKNKESVIIEHPETCLLPLGKELLSGVEKAWESVKLDTGAIVWKLLTQAIPQDGDSLSAVVASSVYSLYRNTYYNAQLAITGIIGDEVDDEPTFLDKFTGKLLSNFKIIPVAHEDKKLEGAFKLGLSQAVLAKSSKNGPQPQHRSKENLDKLKEQGLKGIEYVSNLRALIELTQLECPKLIKVSDFPSLPKYFQKRTTEVKELIEKLLVSPTDSLANNESIKSNITGIYGMGGSGKTTLAMVLGDSNNVNLNLDYQVKLRLWRAFSDGIVWIQLEVEDKKTDLIHIQNTLIKKLELSVTTIQASNVVNSNKTILKEYFTNKRCLLILDNLWTSEQLDAFNVTSGNSKMLITTRNEELLGDIAAKYSLPPLTHEEALRLLAHHSGQHIDSLLEEAKKVAHQWCDNLPFAIELCGALIRDNQSTNFGWNDLLLALKNSKGEILNKTQTPMEKIIKISIEQLVKEISKRFNTQIGRRYGKCYKDLAVFQTGTTVPITAVTTLWQYDDPDLDENNPELTISLVKNRLSILHNRALLTVNTKNNFVTIKLHDLAHIYLKKLITDSQLQKLHKHLLVSYKKNTTQPWHTVEDDGYLYQNLAYHLRQAKCIKELKELLLNYYWLEKKLAVTNINSLLSDYSFTNKDEDVELVYKVLEQKSYILRNKKNQLASQLLGTINRQSSPLIQKMLNDASQNKVFPWLKPLSNSLIISDLVATFNNHSESITAVAVYQDKDKCIAISASEDKSLIMWNLYKKEMISIVSQKLNFLVNSIIIHKKENNLFALLACCDQKVRICNLVEEPLAEEPKEIFNKHKSFVTAITLYEQENNLFAISASQDYTLRKWTIDNPTKASKEKKHDGYVNSVAVYQQNGKPFAISASKDETLKVWDLDNDQLIRTLRGHFDEITAVAVYQQDEKHFAISGSKNKTLKLWQVDNDLAIKTLEDHSDEITAVAVYQQDGKPFAISASRDNTLKIWGLDLESKTPIRTLQGHSAAITAVAVYQQDGKPFAISASEDKTLKIWELTNKNTTVVQKHLSRVNSIAVYKKGEELFAISSSCDKTLKIWSLATKQEIKTIESHTAAITAVAVYEKAGKTFVISASREEVQIWNLEDLESKQPNKIFKQRDRICSIVIYHNSNRTFAISNSQDKNLKIWDLDSKELPKLINVHNPVSTIAIYERENKFFIIFALEDKTLEIRDLIS